MKTSIFDNMFLETADCASSYLPFENHKGTDGLAEYAAKTRISRETSEAIHKNILQSTSWISYAAKVYNTSPDVSDYFTVPTIIMPTDLPNRNGTAFPRDELAKFDPEIGDHVYRGWKGKPVYVDHKNSNYPDAIGAVVDVSMRKINDADGGLWKVIALMAIDRTKNPKIAKDIQEGRRRTYSMGAMVKAYCCSLCGAEGYVKPGIRDKYEAMPCGREHAYFDRNGHFRSVPSKDGKNRHLGFLNAMNVKPFEISSVSYPAFASAFTPESQISEL